jgi:hypothetical protein
VSSLPRAAGKFRLKWAEAMGRRVRISELRGAGIVVEMLL